LISGLFGLTEQLLRGNLFAAQVTGPSANLGQLDGS
jgi:hypothetical protein